MQNGDNALPSISLAGIGQLVKSSNVFNSMIYFDNMLHTYSLPYCLDTGMHSGNKTSPSTSLAG